MRIERMRIPGFGRLGGTVEFDPSRCSLILAPNEAGKSTLVAALLAGLYGLPQERRSKHNPIPEREAFRPWGGGPFGVEVDFLLGDQGYRIRRDFASERVEVRESRTGRDVVERFRVAGGRPAILEGLLGLEREDFSRSAVVEQEEIQAIRDGADITLRLQRFATSHASDTTAGEAVSCLEAALREYPGTQLAGPGKVETEIGRIDEQLAAIREQRHRLQEEHDAAAAELRDLDGLAARVRETEAVLRRLDELRIRATLAEIDAQLAAQARAADAVRSLEAERTELAALADFPLQSAGELNGLRGTLSELAQRIETLRSRRRETRRQHEAVVARRRALGEFGRVAADPLEALAVRLDDGRDRLRTLRQAIRGRRRDLRRRGIDVDGFFRLRERFGALDADEERLLREYRERRLEAEVRARREPGAPATGRRLRGLLPAAGVLVAVAGIVLWAAAGQAGAGLTLMVAGILLLAAGWQWRRQEEPPGADVGEVEALRRRLGILAGRLGYPDGDAAVAAFRRMEETSREAAGLAADEEEAARVEDEVAALGAAAAEVLGGAGRELPAAQVRPRDLERLRDDLREAGRLDERAAELAARGRQEDDEVASVEDRRRQAANRIREILADAGLPAIDEEAPDDGIRRFAARAEAARRYRRIVDERLPETVARLEPESWHEKRRAERRALEELLAGFDAGGAPPVPEHSSGQYDLEYRRTAEALGRLRSRRGEVFARVGDLLRRYREEMPGLLSRQEELESARRRANRFARAVHLAADRLREISRESYEEWATALNERANRILVYLNPAYRDLRFDTDLSFTLEDVATGRRLNRDEVDVHLSVGARDQVYLAIRLAVSDYFSADRYRLPLILDDPFTAADDARFDRAMVFLTERISRRHQVILLSCQRERHERFRERHPDLYDARIVEVPLPRRTGDAAQWSSSQIR
jgi:DNA repair exonuclease SbcCD ATPase subunit